MYRIPKLRVVCFFLLSSILAARVVQAQKLKTVITVAILPFKSSGSVSEDNIKALAAEIRTKMRSAQIDPIVDAGKLEKSVTRRRMEEPDCFSKPACLEKLGEDLDADFLVSGIIEESYGIINLTLQPFDVYRKSYMDKISEIRTSAFETWANKFTTDIAARFASSMYEKRPPPKPTTGVIAFATSPAGATVYIDKVKKNGVTPLTIVDITPGNRRITFEKGPIKADKEISIKAGDTLQMTLTLIAVARVTTVPPGATVYLDGTQIPTGSKQPIIVSDLPPGMHTFKAINQDSAIAEQKIEFRAGDTTEVSLELKPTRGVLRVTTVPPGATIFLDSARIPGVSPAIVNKLKPGTHKIRALGKDSAVAEQAITISAGDTTDVALKLRLTTAALHVVSQPSGATVSLDGAKLAGATPITAVRLTPGKRRLKALGPDSSVVEQAVELVAGDTTHIELKLKPTRAVLALATSPAGATAYLDSIRLTSSTPLQIGMLKPGRYLLRAIGKDSSIAEQKIELTAGDTVRITLELKSTRATLMVTTTPPGATVYLDSARLPGIAPLTVSRIVPGSYTVRAIGKDSAVAQQKIELTAADTTRVSVVLKSTKASLAVTTTPAGATVYLDSVRLPGIAPLTVSRIVPGSYTVRAIGKDSAVAQQKIELSAADTARVSLVLKSTKASLGVTTTPSGATVYLDTAKLPGTTPLTISKLTPGSFLLRAIGPDSAIAEQRVELTAGDTTKLKLALSPTKAVLSVTTNPSGAVVFLDTARLPGTTPLVIGKLAPGIRNIKVLAKDSAVAGQQIELVAGDTARVVLTPRHTTATIVVGTTPPGAKVFLDDVRLPGVTPLVASRLPPGKYLLKTIASDSAVAERNIELTAGDTGRVQLTFASTTGSLSITSVPSGATVFFGDTKLQGVTPLTAAKLRPGKYTVRALGKDCSQALQSVELAAGDSLVVNLQLRSTTATINVSTVPAGAIVYLDAVRLPGKTPLTRGRIKPGTYELRAMSHDSSAIAAQAIEIEAGETLKVNLPLKPTTAVLIVSTEPRGASVFLDTSKLTGATPITGRGIRPGMHTIKAVWKDSSFVEQVADMMAGDTLRLTLTKKPVAPAPQPVAAEPAIEPPSSPAVVSAAPAPIQIDSSAKPMPAEPQAAEPEPVKTPTELPKPQMQIAQLVITTTPPGAVVFLDSFEMPDQTPMTLVGIPPGPHHIRVEKDGRHAEDVVYVKDGGESHATLTIPSSLAAASKTPVALVQQPEAIPQAEGSGPVKSAEDTGNVHLTLSTIPTGALVYVNPVVTKRHRPSYTTPCEATLNRGDTLRWAIFRRGYRDTILTIPANDGPGVKYSVRLFAADSQTMALQAIRERERKQYRTGVRLIPSSGVFLAGSILFYVLANNDYATAQRDKDYLEASVLDRSSNKYSSMVQENRDRTHSGNFKSGLGTTLLVLGAGLCGTGIVLLF